MGDRDALAAAFQALYGGAIPTLFRAPGRVNLIGEHTDYNQGLAMPAALQFDTTLAIAPHPAPRLRVRSLVFDEAVEIPLHDLSLLRKSQPRSHWSDYVIGVVLALWQHGVAIEGADLLIDSDIPLGSGLSSSASFEVCVALALSETANRPLDKLELATLCQEAENHFVGMRCGIMDQYACVFGRRDHALALDCRTLDHRTVPLTGRDAVGPRAPPSGSGTRSGSATRALVKGTGCPVADARPPVEASLVVSNTGVRHSHAGGEYNRRRADCERAVAHLSRALPHIQSLRDVSLADLADHGRDMDAVIRRRAQHVITENTRVTQAVAALEAGDSAAFGDLMRSSHRSLRDDYEVSCAELDLMVDIADGLDGVFGARMTGGGFGGCTVNWVRTDAVGEFTAELARRYATAVGRRPEIYVCTTADGAARLGT